jgi:signal transduction histidine kinase
VIYDQIRNYFLKAQRASLTGNSPDIQSFLSFLIESADAAVYREELLPRIESFRKKTKEQQAEELPGLYLFIEKYIFKSSDPNLQRFRKSVGEHFESFLSEQPDFQIIFLPYDQQVNLLCNRFLKLVCLRLAKFLGDSADSSWGSLNRWLAQQSSKENNSPSFLVSLPFADAKHYSTPASVINYISLSHHFFKDVEKRFSTNFILTHFNSAYESLAMKFRNLDSFHELIKLFPNKTLDASKLNLLSIQQIKELLLEKVESLEKLSAELLDKNDQLEENYSELNAQSDLVNLQNKKLQEAQIIIEQKNKELSEYSSNLENVVEKRTKELETANEILKQYTENLEEHAFAISHHVKAPVARILGLIYLLNNHPDEVQSGDVLSKLEDSVNDLNAILAELVHSLNIKKDASHIIVESCDLSKLVTSIVDELKQLHQISAKLEFSIKGGQEVNTDKNYLTQALRHILDNAFKFRTQNLSLAIRTDISSSPEEIKILISDNGIGFPLEIVKEKLFSPFQRFNYSLPGKGMGLYFAKQLIDVLDGSIEIESTPEKGTAVSISLPIRTK